MKIASFSHNGREGCGIVSGDHIVPLAQPDMLEFLKGGKESLKDARRLAESGDAYGAVAIRDVKLLAPIPHPVRNVFCVGRNYKLHIEEGARANSTEVKFPPVPEFFTKQTNTVTGPDTEVLLHPVTQKLDYEVELAIVIGRGGKDISRDAAKNHIFGFTIVNDVTARDLQRAHGQWFKGKSLDTTCPMGPWIVTADEFDLNAEHRIWLKVNGETRQDSVVSDMLFDCYDIVSHLSQGLTLEPGDVIATGTPSGVGLGMQPQVWLKAGDVLEAGIDGIGSLSNTVRAV
jgi:2-keto-4-pentenoate hydratase/2-oxohepta-3-ene-1,7-dioic acid hydratase in catechol pathway